MSETDLRGLQRQVLGKRMGADPYYVIEEQRAERLLLRSRPDANHRAGRTLAGCGGTLLLLSMVLFIITFISSWEQFGAFFTGMILSWPCGVVGGVAIIGGLAIARTVNTICVDAAARTITYTQTSRRERRQVMPFDAVRTLRLRTQQFVPPGFIRRPQRVVVLEFVTHEGHVWLVDSAAERAPLAALAVAFGACLGLAIDNGLDEDEHDDQDDQDDPREVAPPAAT